MRPAEQGLPSIEIKETGVSLGRRSLRSAVPPADGHLPSPTVERLPGLRENLLLPGLFLGEA